MKTRISLIALFCALCNIVYAQKTDYSTVDKFDMDRFLGKWYEIARYNHFFEKNLHGTTAEYSYHEDGMIRVINRGYKHSLDGKLKTAEGKAKFNKNGKPGQLRVSFFGPFYSDYFVLELDQEHYQYAVIGSSNKKYLWIMSRTPTINDEVKNKLLYRLKQRNYNIQKLIWVEQIPYM